MRIAGIGFRKGADGADILAAIDRALAEHALDRADIDAIAVAASKAGEPGAGEAAALIGKPLVVIADHLVRMSSDTPTRSSRVVALFGVGSLAEAVALAAAGPGATLAGPRSQSPIATCAIATMRRISN